MLAGRRRQPGHGVRARGAAPGGAFRYAGKAPLFQEVARQSSDSFERYIDQLWSRLRREAGARFASAPTSRARPLLLAPFDRIVIATGARYRFGLGPVARACSISAPARWPGMRTLF